MIFCQLAASLVHGRPAAARRRHLARRRAPADNERGAPGPISVEQEKQPSQDAEHCRDERECQPQLGHAHTIRAVRISWASAKMVHDSDGALLVVNEGRRRRYSPSRRR